MVYGVVEVINLKEELKKRKLEKIYVFFGHDEALMLEGISYLSKLALGSSIKELNYSEFDGREIENFHQIINACETLPFMNDKKVVVVKRAVFLEEFKGENKSINEKIYKDFLEYIERAPEHCVLILVHPFYNKRDKALDKLKKLDKKLVLVKSEKLKGLQLENKIKDMFLKKNKEIDKVSLKAFTSKMELETLSIVEKEIEKLCDYTEGREIKKEDINFLFIEGSHDDIFDLINLMSTKKAKEAIEVLNMLLYKGEKVHHILSMIEKQFSNLFKIKLGIENGKSKEELIKDLRMNPYQCDILISQSKRFSRKDLIKIIDICLNTEKRLKSISTNGKIELELLIIKAITT